MSRQGDSRHEKVHLYFPQEALNEIDAEAKRLERSLAWVVQRAWRMARLEVSKLPSDSDSEGDDQ